jgi:hypothetical protein
LSAVITLAWLVLLAGVSLVSGLRHRAPSGSAFVAVAALWMLRATTASDLVVEFSKDPATPLALRVLCVGLVTTPLALGWGCLRRRWEGWGYVVASVWLYHATIAVVLQIVDYRGVYYFPDPGLWCLEIGLFAALPGILGALVPMPAERR